VYDVSSAPVGLNRAMKRRLSLKMMAPIGQSQVM
jgi:hypothetical protein